MNAGDQPPDVDDLARSMMQLLGVHEHDEPHERRRQRAHIVVQGADFAG